MSGMDKYFVVEPGAEPHGPYPLPEIADLLAAGTVTPRAILRKAGDAAAPPRPTVIDVAAIEPLRPAQVVEPVVPVVVEPAVAVAAEVDHTNPIEPLDEGWEGETEILPDEPVHASVPSLPPLPPPAAPHHRAARGTQPPPPMSLAVVPELPRKQPPRKREVVAPPQQQMVKPAEDPPPLRDPKQKKLFIAVGAGVAGLAAAGVAIAMIVGGGDAPQVKDALVRVSTPSNTGTGFLINGPDEYIYVATANHIVDRGERVLIERDVAISDKKHYVEAYPETEIVATDPDADLAIIRVKNVEAKRFARLPLAKEPVKDAKIFSYGYPGSSLAKHAGLVSKDGKILSLVRFPAYDDRYARVMRENAVEGLLVSTDIEPGFSGGPTTNQAG